MLLCLCGVQMIIITLVTQTKLPNYLMSTWPRKAAKQLIWQHQTPLAHVVSWLHANDSYNVTRHHHQGRHAYAFLVAAVDPNYPFYRGFLYNILVSTRILRQAGSTADVVVMIQMSSKTTLTVLPDEDAEPLHKSNITIRYLQKTIDESFYSAVMEKFRILELTNYTRVLFMDADLMPYCNLDYLFHLSEGSEAILKPNLITAWMTEPSNAGFFMLQPGEGQFQELWKHIDERDRIGAHLPYPHFDVVKGFGHEIVPPDHWVTLKGQVGTKWTFQSAFGGQGLLYHWTKYVKKNVSIIIKDEIQNWFASDNKTVFMERQMFQVLQTYKCQNVPWWRLKHAPQSDFKVLHRWKSNECHAYVSSRTDPVLSRLFFL